MKPAHEMTAQERKTWKEARLDEARYLARMNQQVADSYAGHNPARASKYQRLSDGWAQDASRIKAMLA